MRSELGKLVRDVLKDDCRENINDTSRNNWNFGISIYIIF